MSMAMQLILNYHIVSKVWDTYLPDQIDFRKGRKFYDKSVRTVVCKCIKVEYIK